MSGHHKKGGPTSRDEVPSTANFPPHLEEDSILLLCPRGLGDSWVKLLTETLSSLVVRSSRKILGNLVPTMAMLANGLQE